VKRKKIIRDWTWGEPNADNFGETEKRIEWAVHDVVVK